MTKLTDLQELLSLHSADLVHIVDVSNTTDDVAGSSFKVSIETLSTYIASLVSGGLTVQVPTGDIDGANTVFEVTATPKWIVADGIIYFSGAGYSIAGLSITMDIPPSQFIRAII